MTKLETINAEDLQNRTYEPTPFLVDKLIPEGLHILAGAPKIGKSWLFDLTEDAPPTQFCFYRKKNVRR